MEKNQARSFRPKKKRAQKKKWRDLALGVKAKRRKKIWGCIEVGDIDISKFKTV